MKIGLEIHFQLGGKKLFCSCSTEGSLSNKKIERKLTPVMSEMGKLDSAVAYESIRKREFIYDISDNSCLVEFDEEPPHSVDEKALDTALAVSMALHCRTVDYATFMRKIVIDGSNTSGFQRTGITGMDGFVETSRGNVKISTITLEEDACRKISEKSGIAEYSLDRLGIPLIEISTEPDIIDEEHAEETARLIGHYVMSMDNFRGEVDSIRQDVNFSMGFGRVEIKGVSKLSFIKDTIRYEIKRQESLKEISDKLKGKVSISDFSDISGMLASSGSAMVEKALKSGNAAYCAVAYGLKGYLKNGNYRLGREFADVAKNLGIGGLMHSDEFPGYGIPETVIDNIYSKMKIKEGDAILIALTSGDKIKDLKVLIEERLKNIMNMDLAETRAATVSGETRYLRPLAGKERMYPETDIPVIEISSSRIKKIEKIIPVSLKESLLKLTEEYKLSKVEAESIINNNLLSKFTELYIVYPEAHTISRIILQKVPELENKYKTKIDYHVLFDAVTIASKMKWNRQVLEKALDIIIGEGTDPESIVYRNELKMIDMDQMVKIIEKLIENDKITEKNLIPAFRNATEASFNPGDVIKIYNEIIKRR